jgi:hypothetical protein
MRRFRMVAVVLACVLCAFMLGWQADAQQGKIPPKPVVWEYRDGANLTIQQLNTLGAEGWELAVVSSYGKDYYYILKRQK